ncbi:MAG TPA: extracellular solute-binding protein [Spirochaetota bacterium]|nr:extracellular solute-binding protein [Spirochaetota bacterium]
MKFRNIFLFILFITFSTCKKEDVVVQNSEENFIEDKTVVLTLSSWRKDDIKQINEILAEFNKNYPDIKVRHEPMTTDDVILYNKALTAQFEVGEGPDLYYLASFALSKPFFEKGFLENLSDLPGIKENFSKDVLKGWSTDDGIVYGVPFIATSHGIYYNKNIFKDLDIKIPDSWEDLLEISKQIKTAGIAPFSNGSYDKWTMAECIFMNVAPNFLGGKEGRLEYLDGKKGFNDKKMVSLFESLRDLGKFFLDEQEQLSYTDSLQIFVEGRAAMLFGGSWDIPFFESQKIAFDWSVFPPPPKKGEKKYITFHLDAGIGMNPKIKNKKEALLFLQWLTTFEAGTLLANRLPGFFPMHNKTGELNNKYANTFLLFNKDREKDFRFAWEKISEGTPSAYDLIQDNTISVVSGKISPKQAADNLQEGLSKWYEPAKKFSK